MRKKLDTRFPAARIKKIMQADEDVGKIAMAVPVLVSKALELFLQDLCDRTYDITLQRGAKTVSSLHLKHCVQSYNVFDFLREVVSKVPDYGHSDISADISKRRKTVPEEYNDIEEETRKSRMNEVCHASSSGRVRGRGRGRGRGRSNRMTDRESSRHENESELSISIPPSGKQISSPGNTVNTLAEMESSKEIIKTSDVSNDLQTFDLNSGTNVGAEKSDATPTVPLISSTGPNDTKGEEYPGWSLSEMDSMAIDPLQIAQLNSRLDEEEEDYDEEE